MKPKKYHSTKSGLIGMFSVFSFIIIAILLGGATEHFVFLPSIMICFGGMLSLALASAGVSDLGHALRSLRCLFISLQDRDLRARNTQVLRHMITYAYASGVIGAMIGIIQMCKYQPRPDQLYGSISLTTLTLLYSLIVSECILRPGARRIEAEIERKRIKIPDEISPGLIQEPESMSYSQTIPEEKPCRV